jgi:hypothetical protein
MGGNRERGDGLRSGDAVAGENVMAGAAEKVPPAQPDEDEDGEHDR